MSKSELPIQVDKTDSFSRIVKFMGGEESGIILSAKEEQILARWFYCNALLKERKFTSDDIVDKVKGKFSVSVATARNDLAQTRSLFVRLVKDLKRYTLHHHIEDIQLEIQKRKHDKSFAPFLPKLFDSLTKALAILPEDVESPDVPAPVVIVNVVNGQNVTPTMNFEEALKAADDLIDMERNHDYTEFEELPDEPK